MQVQEAVVMTDNRYQLAGWVAIAQAIFMVASIVLSILEAIAAVVVLRKPGLAVGPSDFLVLAGSAMAIYTLLMFRRLLNERYDFHEIDTLITLSIIWNVLFAIGDLVLGAVYVGFRSADRTLGALLVILPYFAGMMLFGGIVDIMIGIRLLKIKERLTDLLATMAYLSLVGGICAVSLVFAPVAALIGLVSYVVLGLIFLREPEEAEFV